MLAPAWEAGRGAMKRFGFAWLCVLLLASGCANEMILRAERPIPDPAKPQSAPPPSLLAGVPRMAIRLIGDEGAADSRTPVGRREAGLGHPAATIYLTESPSRILERLIAEELRRGGHSVVEGEAQVDLELHIVQFDIAVTPVSMEWNLNIALNISLELIEPSTRALRGEYSFNANRQAVIPAWPSAQVIEKALGESLNDLARVIASRQAFAAALADASRPQQRPVR